MTLLRGLGCIKDKLDGRDYLMRAYLPAVKIPPKVDWTKKMSPVRDQGDEGTCVGFAATCGMKEYHEFLDYRKLVTLSPRFLYNEAKKIDGMPRAEGTTIRAAMQALSKKGVCQEKFWPYSPHQTNKAGEGAFSNAKKFRVMTYARILNLNELRLSLATKGPCVIGVEVFEEMMKTKTGLVPMPKKNKSILGGHAICPVGYNDKKKVIKFKNSWSDAWGQKGYGYLPYTYIERYMMDAWSSVDIDDPNPLTLASVLNYRDRALV
ncbi:MAG: C1 family peptidase [Nitrospirae bacterium]|nr:C1 family peptidase [Nitrospirota bacterium]